MHSNNYVQILQVYLRQFSVQGYHLQGEQNAHFCKPVANGKLLFTRDLQKVSALIFFKLYLLRTSKANYVTFLYSHPAFRCIFPSVLPTF